MKLATARIDGATHAVRVLGDTLADLKSPDLDDFLARPSWREEAGAATEPVWSAVGAIFAPLVRRPSKIICVGLNYRQHILEMGHALPTYPTLFAKFPDALIGATDDIERPPETVALDWEVELAVVIGHTIRRANPVSAVSAIAGFTVCNDITCRDWQSRTQQWLQGKTWQSTTPLGPYLVTPDELDGGVRPALDMQLLVDGIQMQAENTSDLLFDPVELVAYISTIVTLHPGDVIATGTPAGVGHAQQPARYLVGGEIVVAEIAGIGRVENRVVNVG